MSLPKQIWFNAVTQKDNPIYLVTFRGKLLFYDPRSAMLQFEQYTHAVKNICQLDSNILHDLGLEQTEIGPLITFCQELKPISANNLPYPVAALPVCKRMRPTALPSADQSPIGRQTEARLKVGRGNQPLAEPKLCYNPRNVPYTEPEILYNYKDGRNVFTIGFSYLNNGLMDYHLIKNEKLNSIDPLGYRKQKAEEICERIAWQLMQGWSPEKVKEAAEQ